MVVLIELENLSKSYVPGQLIKGLVILKFDKPQDAKEVIVTLRGTEAVKWKERKTTVKVGPNGHVLPRSKMITCTASETIVLKSISLDGDGGNLFDVGMSTSYKFRFTLPKNTPSTFKGDNGSVKYSIQAELRNSRFKLEKVSEMPIKVNATLDLNREDIPSQPEQLEEVKGENVFLFRKGEISFVFKMLKRSGFVPGELVQFTAQVTNGSNRKVSGMRTKLVQVTEVFAKGKSKKQEKVVCEEKGPEVEKGEQQMWAPKGFVVPAVSPPTKLGGICRIIDVQYYILFQVNIWGLDTCLSGKIPVLIGTVPLKDNQ